MSDQAPLKKDAAAIRVFPPGVPLVTIIVGIMLQKFIPIGEAALLPTPLRYWVGGAIIVVSIYALGFHAVRAMRKSGQSENPYKKTTEILKTGPYRVTRNPMYLQMVLTCLGFAIALSNIWILLLTPICALVLNYLVIVPEEAYLETKFGDTYRAYKSEVRRWL